jgi:Dolichyl-phosphate-mannose-protein mannosyltransferase
VAVVATGEVLERTNALDDAPEMSAAKRPSRPSVRRLVDAASVLLAPLVAFYGLRLRAMAPVQLPDPSMHTTYIVQPHDIFVRYAAAFAATARMREAADVGLLEPARISYLLFGAVPGFFVTRYVFALIAIAPIYVLLERLYGRAAGFVGIAVVMTCPVVITAWGTDYPDAAVVSYVAGGLACLAMPCATRWRRGWLVGAAVLLTSATWAHGVGALLAASAVVTYVLVRVFRDRRELLGDILLLAGVAAATTGAFIVGSGLLLGQYNFIGPTFAALKYLNQPSQILLWHSASSVWAPYVAYLFVPPAVLGAFVVTFARRLRAIPTPQLFVGAVAAVQLVVFVYMQFFHHLQTLEMHYFSSTLWASVCLALAVMICELCREFFAGRWRRLLPAATVVAVALAYELDPHVPAFGWFPYGALVAAILITTAFGGRLAGRINHRGLIRIGTLAAIVGVTGCALVLTVARIPDHRLFPNTIFDPPPAYASALGGSAGNLIDAYRVTTELPLFVGAATYPGEQLMMSLPQDEIRTFLELIGIYHAGYDLLPSNLPAFSAGDRITLAERRPAEILVIGNSSGSDNGVSASIASYRPTLLRATVLRSGSFTAHVWLYYLGVYGRSSATPK